MPTATAAATDLSLHFEGLANPTRLKIVWIHESASYLIASLDLVLLACLMASSTRRFTTR